MAISLQNIQRTKHATPPRVLIHGGAKLGKSTFGAAAPNPIFVRTEDGLNGIDTSAFPLATSFIEVKDSIKALQTQPHEFKTVVIDSADWMEALIHEYIIRTEGGSMRTACGGYGNSYVTAANMLKEILDMLDDLNKRLGMIVIVICHSTITEMRDPEFESYDIATLKLHKAASAKLCEWADVIGYAKRPIIVSRKDKESDYKAKSLGENVMNELVVGSSATAVSGNRYGMTGKIPLTWDAFDAALRATFQSAVQTTTQQ